MNHTAPKKGAPTYMDPFHLGDAGELEVTGGTVR